jgi:hypothetical protein
MENGYIGRPLTRRLLLGQTGMAGPNGREYAYRCDRDRLAVT